MKNLSEVKTFGGVDADADTLLADCFQDHEAYVDLMKHERPFVVGRKGSGKTAIFKRVVTTKSFKVFSFGHTFSDYPWGHHELQGLSGVPEELRYVQSWNYLILLSMAKLLLNQDQSQPWNPSAKEELDRIEKFVVDSYGTRDPDVTQLFTPAKRLRISPNISIPGTGLGAKLESLAVSELPRVVQELNRNITQAIMECLNPEHDYYICFDELDRNFDPGDAKYHQMLVGLILAAKQLNQSARTQGKRFSVAVFLRDDIYQRLQFEDKNKITEGMVSTVEWDTPTTRLTLKQLMESRFAATLSTSTDDTVSWGDVFDEDQEMSGRQTKYNHILDRTFLRPRDVIKFCNEVLASYKRRDPDGKSKFGNTDIISARSEYSNYLLRELEDEVHKHEPKYRDYLELLQSLGSLQFDRDEFKMIVDRRSDLVSENDTPGSILRRLFEFSVIAYIRTGGTGGGATYMWRYKDPRVRFDETATSFRVHPGFMEAFGLKKFSKK